MAREGCWAWSWQRPIASLILVIAGSARAAGGERWQATDHPARIKTRAGTARGCRSS